MGGRVYIPGDASCGGSNLIPSMWELRAVTARPTVVCNQRRVVNAAQYLLGPFRRLSPSRRGPTPGVEARSLRRRWRTRCPAAPGRPLCQAPA